MRKTKASNCIEINDLDPLPWTLRHKQTPHEVGIIQTNTLSYRTSLSTGEEEEKGVPRRKWRRRRKPRNRGWRRSRRPDWELACLRRSYSASRTGRRSTASSTSRRTPEGSKPWEVAPVQPPFPSKASWELTRKKHAWDVEEERPREFIGGEATVVRSRCSVV